MYPLGYTRNRTAHDGNPLEGHLGTERGRLDMDAAAVPRRRYLLAVFSGQRTRYSRPVVGLLVGPDVHLDAEGMSDDSTVPCQLSDLAKISIHLDGGDALMEVGISEHLGELLPGREVITIPLPLKPKLLNQLQRLMNGRMHG